MDYQYHRRDDLLYRLLSVDPARVRCGDVTYTYHQHSSDDFTINVVPGTKHCGINDERCKLRYMVDIDYTSDALDSNGFLLDNLDFRTYFASLGPVTISCELLARSVARHYLDELHTRIGSVTRVAVRIYPFGDTYVESIITNDARDARPLAATLQESFPLVGGYNQ